MATKKKSAKWRDVLAQAREALRQAVAQAEAAGVDASKGHFALEQMPYFERALEMAPEGLRQGMAEKMAQRVEAYVKWVQRKAAEARAEKEERQRKEQEAWAEVLARWPGLWEVVQETAFHWQTPWGEDGYVVRVEMTTPWGPMRAQRDERDAAWRLTYNDGLGWEEVKDLETALMEMAAGYARRLQGEERAAARREAERRAEEEAQARRQEYEAWVAQQREKAAHLRPREWLRQAAIAAWVEEDYTEAMAYALVGLLASYVEEDGFALPHVHDGAVAQQVVS